MLDQILTGLAARLSPEMYRVAVQAAQENLSHEVEKMTYRFIIDEMRNALIVRGMGHDEVAALIDRGADRASIAGDVIVMTTAEAHGVDVTGDLTD